MGILQEHGGGSEMEGGRNGFHRDTLWSGFTFDGDLNAHSVCLLFSCSSESDPFLKDFDAYCHDIVL